MGAARVHLCQIANYKASVAAKERTITSRRRSGVFRVSDREMLTVLLRSRGGVFSELNRFIIAIFIGSTCRIDPPLTLVPLLVPNDPIDPDPRQAPRRGRSTPRWGRAATRPEQFQAYLKATVI